MPDLNQIEDCPWCGPMRGHCGYTLGRFGTRVSCFSCDAMGPIGPDQQTALAHWNAWAVRFRDAQGLSKALKEAEDKLAEWQAAQHYSYIGRDGKRVLARDLEDRLEQAETQLAALQSQQSTSGAAALTWKTSVSSESQILLYAEGALGLRYEIRPDEDWFRLTENDRPIGGAFLDIEAAKDYAWTVYTSKAPAPP